MPYCRLVGVSKSSSSAPWTRGYVAAVLKSGRTFSRTFSRKTLSEEDPKNRRPVHSHTSALYPYSLLLKRVSRSWRDPRTRGGVE